jgi:hypothetical protein
MDNIAKNQTRDLSDLVVLERMPDHHRGSRRAARNWGVYPHNGAVRVVTDRATAEAYVEDDVDGYDSIVEDADVSQYPTMTGGE